MDIPYMNSPGKGFDWSREINAQMFVQVVDFLVQSNQKEFRKYRECVREMQKWCQLSSEVRNPAAHTIISVTDDVIRKNYDGRDAEALCKRMQNVLEIIFEKRVKKEVFEMYNTINGMIRKAMEK